MKFKESAKLAKRGLKEKNTSKFNSFKMYQKYLRNYKPAFIYGKVGCGRYLNEKGLDYLKMRDIEIKVNSKNNYIKKRLDEFYVKREEYI